MTQQTMQARQDAPARQMGWPRTLGRLAADRNINPETLLATDYLNHFNEIVMMIEMVGTMPDMAEELSEWAPASYAEHFRRSNFTDKELAILAYENAPPRYRDTFDEIVQHADELTLKAIARIQTMIGKDGATETELEPVCSDYAAKLRRLIDMASGVIHGHTQTIDQSAIDNMMER